MQEVSRSFVAAANGTCSNEYGRYRSSTKSSCLNRLVFHSHFSISTHRGFSRPSGPFLADKTGRLWNKIWQPGFAATSCRFERWRLLCRSHSPLKYRRQIAWICYWWPTLYRQPSSSISSQRIPTRSIPWILRFFPFHRGRKSSRTGRFPDGTNCWPPYDETLHVGQRSRCALLFGQRIPRDNAVRKDWICIQCGTDQKCETNHGTEQLSRLQWRRLPVFNVAGPMQSIVSAALSFKLVQ